MQRLRSVLIFSLIVSFAGCDREADTPHERAAKAQRELEEARKEAAEKIADAEEDAVDRIQDARTKSQREIERAKEEAVEMVRKAEQNLEKELQTLSSAPLKADVEVETKTPVVVDDNEVITATEGEAVGTDTP